MRTLPETLEAAVGPFTDVIEATAATAAVPADQLTNPTPCADYAVRDLLRHLLYWSPRMAAAVRGEPPLPAEGGEEGVELGADWAERLRERTADLVAALGRPGALAGTTTMGGGELPAVMIGGMALCELVLHGWDLAVAVGAGYRCPEPVAEELCAVLARMGDQGRAMGVFGPVVEVPASAPPLERALGLSGRDPEWRPAGVGDRSGPLAAR
ncbi:TIGR03086 family protein [Amycolatopsis arida]|uniref:TIGR03086 family protein n=1 Tax=Amycolatopsis arida TaxID=587909 RepID=A0A1I5R5E9_9PSEU|nr:TIGR03086 family metal-binding protein [Amycolatopsis arida]TDX99083.1 uncharacterized protein (TIGR03086 family) [Amycolatopsis arida]SFP53600.1 TIGR03086 family protein [Amycolatopsis arida]